MIVLVEAWRATKKLSDSHSAAHLVNQYFVKKILLNVSHDSSVNVQGWKRYIFFNFLRKISCYVVSQYLIAPPAVVSGQTKVV